MGQHDKSHRMDEGIPSELANKSVHRSVEANQLRAGGQIPSHTNRYMWKGSAHVTNYSQDNAMP